MKDTFLSLLKESVIMQAVLTVMLVGTTVTLVLLGKEVPESIGSMTLLVVGYFFGSKTGVAQGKLAERNQAAFDSGAQSMNAGEK